MRHQFKIAPTMHKSRYLETKNRKKFLGRGTPQAPLPMGRGTPPPHTPLPWRLWRLDSARAFGFPQTLSLPRKLAVSRIDAEGRVSYDSVSLPYSDIDEKQDKSDIVWTNGTDDRQPSLHAA